MGCGAPDEDDASDVLARAGRIENGRARRWATRKQWIGVFRGKVDERGKECIEGALWRNQRQQRRMQGIRARRLLGGDGLLVRRMALRNTGFGGTLVRVNHLAGADRGMQDEAREYQCKEPEPQPCSQRASPLTDREYARQIHSCRDGWAMC